MTSSLRAPLEALKIPGKINTTGDDGGGGGGKGGSDDGSTSLQRARL
ncbi:unnamed protein product, partial [Mesocestoides corti]|uniref:Uncharacterized protein n=1 Tax=Mesocestoides corti TaxID=53468 RepID=A0A0R3UB42_MESCO